MTEKILADKQTPWRQLTDSYREILGRAGWAETSYDFEFVSGNVKNVNGTLEDPAVWSMVLLGGAKIGIKMGRS